MRLSKSVWRSGDIVGDCPLHSKVVTCWREVLDARRCEWRLGDRIQVAPCHIVCHFPNLDIAFVTRAGDVFVHATVLDGMMLFSVIGTQ